LTQAITNGRFPPPTVLLPDLSPELEQIILTAMASNREERFPSSSAMAEALRALQLRPLALPLTPLPEMSTVAEMERAENANHPVPKRPQTPFPRHPNLELPSLSAPAGEPFALPTPLSLPSKEQLSPTTNRPVADIEQELPIEHSPSDPEGEFAALPEEQG
jgi:hypothetical protein